VTQEKELLETQAVAERARREIVDKDGRIQELSQLVERLQEEQTRAIAEMQKMRGEKDHLITEALSNDEVRQELEGKVAALRTEREALQSAHDKLTVEMQSKDHTLSNLAEGRGALTAKITELESSVADRNFEVEDRDRQLSVAHNRILGLEARLREQVGCSLLLPFPPPQKGHTQVRTHTSVHTIPLSHTA
jgi:chromosome segregation ATPase